MSPKPSGGPDESRSQARGGNDLRSVDDDFASITGNLGDVQKRGQEILEQQNEVRFSLEPQAPSGKGGRYGSKMRSRDPMSRARTGTLIQTQNFEQLTEGTTTIAPKGNVQRDGDNTDSGNSAESADNEPKDLNPDALDPSNPDKDPYDTIGNEFDKQLDPTSQASEQDIADLENGTTPEDSENGTPEMSEAESQRFNNDQLGLGYTAGENAKGRGQKKGSGIMMALATRGLTRRRTVAGGSLIAVLTTFAIVGLSSPSMQLAHWRDSFLNNGNRTPENIIRNRRPKSLYTMIRKQARAERFENALNVDKFAEKWRAQGGILEFADDGVTPTKFGHVTTGGVERLADLNNPDFDATYNQLFGGIEGREARRALDRVASGRVAQFRGKVGRKVWSYLKAIPTNWLDGKKYTAPDGEELSDLDQLAAKLRHSDDLVDPELATRSGVGGNTDDLDGDGKPDASGDKRLTGVADDAPDAEASAEFRRRALEDPRLTDSDLIPGIANGGADRIDNTLGNAADGVLREFDSGSTPSLRVLEEVSGDLLGRVAKKVFTAVNLIGPVETGCRLVGTINYIASVRNMMVATELTRFAIKWYSIADHQRAGLVSSEAVNLMMIFMQYPNPENGKGFAQAGGVLRMAGQQPDAYINPIHHAKASTGRDTAGKWDTLARIANKVPGVNNPTVCRTVTNGYVQVATLAGTVVVSVVAAIVTGGASLAGNASGIAWSFGMAVATEIAFQVGTPLLVKAGARMLITGSERNGELIGNLLASGVGSYYAQSGAANGLRPSTKKQFAQAKLEADQEYRQQLAEEGVLNRYVNFANGNSLLRRVAFSLPIGTKGILNTIGFGLPNLTASAGNLGGFASALLPTSKASAANEVTCNDPQIVKFDIATDAFCNPILATAPDLNIEAVETTLKARGELDASGKPTGAFQKYIDNCHSPRAGIFYKAEISKDGKDGNGTNNDCISDPSQPPTESDPACPGGINECRTALYAYMVDRDEIIEDVNEQYETVGAGKVAAPTNANQAGTVSGCPNEPVDASQIVTVAGIDVHRCLQTNLQKLIDDAAAAGVALSGSGWRDINEQIALRRQNCGSSDYAIYEMPSGECSPPTAIPGRSMHEVGVAIDFAYNGSTICFRQTAAECAGAGNAGFDWLVANAAKYGLKNLPDEAWHWSTTGR